MIKKVDVTSDTVLTDSGRNTIKDFVKQTLTYTVKSLVSDPIAIDLARDARVDMQHLKFELIDPRTLKRVFCVDELPHYECRDSISGQYYLVEGVVSINLPYDVYIILKSKQPEFSAYKSFIDYFLRVNSKRVTPNSNVTGEITRFNGIDSDKILLRIQFQVQLDKKGIDRINF